TLEALFPGTRRPLFAAMYAEPTRWWSARELAGRAGVRASAIRLRLQQLCESGVIRQKADEDGCWFQPDPACQVYQELHAIITKLTALTRGAETILMVEDQEATAQITRILLESWGYRVIHAHSADEALEIFAHDGEGIHLVLSDLVMP